MSATSESQPHRSTPRADPSPSSADATAETQLTVATWNVQYGADVDGAIDTIRAQPHLRDADVVLLQEMDEPGTARIADALSADYVYQSGSVHRVTGRDFGNAVLSRHPVSDPAIVHLPHRAGMRGEDRVAVGCVIAAPGGAIHAFSVHTEIPALPLRYRVRQFAAVADACAAPNRVVIGGDFNTLTGRGVAAVCSQMARVGLQHVHPGEPTLRWPSMTSTRSVGLKLDHLFVKGLRPLDAGVITGVAASDHLPLWALVEYGDEGGADSGMPPHRHV